jgi:SAM-dependent methyltransferase
MNEMHEANRSYWNATALHWQAMRERDQLWRICHQQPELVFDGESWRMICESLGELYGKQVGIIGSGDNYAAFALAGQGARVTSIDISEQQLQVAAGRAQALGLEIAFIRADAANLEGVGAAEFDLVFSSNGLFVWISDPRAVFQEIYRVLKPGGFYISYDIHPFMRPWINQVSPLEMEKPYWETGPFECEEEGRRSYEFNWTMADIINPMLAVGLNLRQIAESPARDSSFWTGASYVRGENDDLLDWRTNPRAGLPVWLTVAAQKLNR